MMGAVAAGAFDNGCKITDISPKWIGEFDDKFENSTELIITDTINERKDLFLEKSDVFIVCPGGVGTMDEFFDLITLRKLERHSKKIILFSINHFYDFLFSLLLKMNYEGIIADKTIKMIEVAHTIDELFKLL